MALTGSTRRDTPPDHKHDGRGPAATTGGRRCAETLAALAVAVAIDLLCGEPPSVLHPVVGIGRLIGLIERGAPRGRRGELVYGAAMAAAVPASAAACCLLVGRCVQRLPAPLRIAAGGAALKPAFALRALLGAGARVQTLLEAGDLAAARLEVRSLVSRDTAALDSPLLAAAAVESLAENLTDSVVAPLLAYAAGGLPVAYAYRAINTLDSMVGYRGRYEWLGKASARLDDAANFLPARLAALLLIPASAVVGASPRRALLGMGHGRRAPASPNAGWTMSAAAGALDVRLEKRGHYVLNPNGRAPEPADIATTRRMVAVAAMMAVFVAAAGTLLKQRLVRGR